MPRTPKLLSLLLISALLSGLFAAPAPPARAAFNPPFTQLAGAENPFNGIDGGTRVTPSFADLDGDGDLDAVVGNSDGILSYYRNDGSAITPSFTAIAGSQNPFNSFDMASSSAPAFVDLDGDGDLDAEVGRMGGNLVYLRNTGTAVAPSFVMIPDSSNPFNGLDVGFNSTPAFADLDYDGDLDAIAGELDGTLNYFRNDGTVIAPSFIVAAGSENPFNSVDVGQYSTPAFADLDDDGDLDALVGSQTDGLSYFRNDGTPTTPVFTQIAGGANPFHGLNPGGFAAPSFADLDGDGDLDFVSGENTGSLVYYRNEATPAAAAYIPTPGSYSPFGGVDAGDVTSPTFADLDADGDLDAAVGEAYGALVYYRNEGSASAPHFTNVIGPAYPFGDLHVNNWAVPAFGDLDADGDSDLVVGNGFGNIYYYRNDGTAGAPIFTQTGGTDNPFNGVDVGDDASPSLGDLDGDGDLDAVVGEWEGNLNYFRNDGTAAAPAFTQLTGASNPFNGVSVGRVSAPRWVDLDGDGDLDVVSGEHLGSFKYYRNDGSAAAPLFAVATGSANPFNGINAGGFVSPGFADLDADGDSDMVAGNYDGYLQYLHANRPPRLEPLPAVSVAEDAADTLLDLRLYFQDPDRNSLTYTVQSNTNPGLFSTVTFASDSLTLAYAPNANGSATLTLRAADPFGKWVETTLEVTVIPVNDTPVATAGPDQHAGKGVELAFTGGFSDVEDTAPASVAWDFGDGSAPASGSLTAQHAYPDEGVYTVTLTVTDAGGLATTDTLTVTVIEHRSYLPLVGGG